MGLYDRDYVRKRPLQNEGELQRGSSQKHLRAKTNLHMGVRSFLRKSITFVAIVAALVWLYQSEATWSAWNSVSSFCSSLFDDGLVDVNSRRATGRRIDRALKKVLGTVEDSNIYKIEEAGVALKDKIDKAKGTIVTWDFLVVSVGPNGVVIDTTLDGSEAVDPFAHGIAMIKEGKIPNVVKFPGNGRDVRFHIRYQGAFNEMHAKHLSQNDTIRIRAKIASIDMNFDDNGIFVMAVADVTLKDPSIVLPNGDEVSIRSS